MGLVAYSQQRIKSFACAMQGVSELWRTQAHARIHMCATVAVVIIGLYLNLSSLEWALLVLAISTVWVAEALNTAIEFVVDLVSPGYHPLAGKAKDVAAGAVLLASFFALVIGVLVLGPKLVELIY